MQIPPLISTLVLFLVSGRISVVAVQRQTTERVPGAPRGRLVLDEAPRASDPFPQLLNTTKLSLNPSSLINDVYDVQCNDRLGTFDSPEDCDSALAMIRGGPEILTFADRQTHAIRSWMYPLPWRWMGAKADCYIQPGLVQGATTGRLNMHQLRAAATNVIDTCAARQQRGGVISGLAGDGNILLTLGRFRPGGESVRCGGTQIKVSRCRDILSGMQVVAYDERFGLANEEVDVQVPYRISSADESCSLDISTAGRSGTWDLTSWFSIWEAANAVYYKCTSMNARGIFTGLGKEHDLSVAITGPTLRKRTNGFPSSGNRAVKARDGAVSAWKEKNQREGSWTTKSREQ